MRNIRKAIEEESKMLQVKFYEQADDALLKFAVIIAKYQGK